MKKKLKYKIYKKDVEREMTYIPLRYIIAILLTVFEIVLIIGISVAVSVYVPFFSFTALLMQILCIFKIISSDDNPDYKVPWLFFVLILPIAGFMLYIMFYSRKLHRKYVKRLKETEVYRYKMEDGECLSKLKSESCEAASMAKMITKISHAHLFCGNRTTYFPIGEDMQKSLLCDLEAAEKFIFMQYFIIEEGSFWNSILDVLKRKAAEGVCIRIIYDDIGCMKTLPSRYTKTLKKHKIDAVIFSRLRGNADSEFNNRSHRKITVIDGKKAYTGGINIADEYINELKRFGHWKDTAVKIEGEAVWELTRLFLVDYALNTKEMPKMNKEFYPQSEPISESGYLIPFGDGPRPIYQRRVGKSVISSIVNAANDYVYITTPYLIADNETFTAIENAALRGVDVRIILPAVPDKKLIYSISRSFYKRLMSAGVRIYEYTPGFIHAKTYIADEKYAMLGTINLDYRSLAHHFENGVWIYKDPVISDIKNDLSDILEKSKELKENDLKANLFTKILRSIVKIFSPML